MKTTFLLALAISSAAYSQANFAGPINDNYTTGDTLTATTLNNIKSAVNDNDTTISDIDASITGINTRISDNTSSIDAAFSGDGSAGELTITGSINWVTNPPVNPYFGNVIIMPGGILTVPAGTTIYCSGTFLNDGTLIVEPGTTTGRTLSTLTGSVSASNGRQYSQHPGDTPAPATMGENHDTVLQANVTLYGGFGGLPIPKTVATTAFGNFRIGGGSGGGSASGSGKGGGLVKIYAGVNILNSGIIEAKGGDAIVPGHGGGGGGIVILATNGGGIQNITGTIDVSGGNAFADNANYIGNGGGGGGGIIIMASSPVAPLVGTGTEIVSGGSRGLGTISLTTTTQSAGGGGGGSGGLGGNGGNVSIVTGAGTPATGLGLATSGASGYVISLALDPRPLAR